MGRSLKTSLLNLGLCGVADEVLRDYGIEAGQHLRAGAGRGPGQRRPGPFGRLLSGRHGHRLDYPGTGYSILYEYGIFKQKIVDGWQTGAAPTTGCPAASVWLKSHRRPGRGGTLRRRDRGELGQRLPPHRAQKLYQRHGRTLRHVCGRATIAKGVSQLRLWKAKAPGFDMDSFNAGEYGNAHAPKAPTPRLISKVLYPNDNHIEGKILRLRQQYFLCCRFGGGYRQAAPVHRTARWKTCRKRSPSTSTTPTPPWPSRS